MQINDQPFKLFIYFIFACILKFNVMIIYHNIFKEYNFFLIIEINYFSIFFCCLIVMTCGFDCLIVMACGMKIIMLFSSWDTLEEIRLMVEKKEQRFI